MLHWTAQLDLMEYMGWLFRLLERLRRWWRGPTRKTSFSGVERVESSADPTTALQAGKLVLIGSRETPKWLRLVCPCGCGDVIALNLMPTHQPRWSVTEQSDGTLTVLPSVDSQRCCAHF